MKGILVTHDLLIELLTQPTTLPLLGNQLSQSQRKTTS